MDEGTGIAEVIDVMKHPVVELAEGVEVGGSSTIRVKLRTGAARRARRLKIKRSLT